MKWSEMAAVQRDTLVYEKVMGETNFICTGKLVYDGDNAKYMHHYYVCQECKVRLTVTSFYLEKCKPPTEHCKPIPHYTTDMNAAWQILAKMQEDNTHWDNYCTEIEKMGDLAGKSTVSEVLKVLTPEHICIAALRAYGVEVEQ